LFEGELSIVFDGGWGSGIVMVLIVKGGAVEPVYTTMRFKSDELKVN